MYKEEMSRKGEDVLSRTHFVHVMWKKEFPDVKIPKVDRTTCTRN